MCELINTNTSCEFQNLHIAYSQFANYFMRI